MPAWLLSVAFHFVLVIVLALTLRAVPRGAAIEPSREVGIVLTQHFRGDREYFQDGDGQNDSQSEAGAPQNVAAVLPSESTETVDALGALPSSASAADNALDLNSLLPSAGGLTQGPGRGKQAGGTVQTGVFGVSGEGSRFVYVFDRSGSMSGFQGRPLAAAKRELIASVRDLSSTHQFQIILYNEHPTFCNPNPAAKPRMLYGNDRDKKLAQEFVEGTEARGGTRHMAAIMAGLKMRPDVLFFLTDAEQPVLSLPELARIRRLNESYGVAIHTIEFGAGLSSGKINFLIRLAEQNNGKHVYVDVTRLPLKGKAAQGAAESSSVSREGS